MLRGPRLRGMPRGGWRAWAPKIRLRLSAAPLEVTGPVRIAVVGCGRITQAAHLPALEKAEGVELAALSDTNESVLEAVARRHGVRAAHTDVSRVWDAPDVEAVLVAASDRFHFDLATQALRAGKHVLVEKPLASNLAQAEALVETVARSGRKLQVGAMKRHDAGLEFAHRFVRESLGEARSFNAWYRIGDLRSGIEATLFPRLHGDPEAAGVEAAFKADRQSYLLATHGAHLYDTVRHLLGDVEAIDARHRDDGRDHTWTALLRTRSGAIGTVTLAADVPGLPAEGIEVFGSEGWLRADIPFPFRRQASTVQAYAAGEVHVPVLTDGDAYERQLEAFARAIREDRPPTPDVVDGLAALALIDATHASARSGREVPVAGLPPRSA